MLLVDMSTGNSPKVLGIAVNKTKMPEIFRLAKADGYTLELVLRGIMRKRGYTKPVQAMKLLEADLGYKNISSQRNQLPCRR